MINMFEKEAEEYEQLKRKQKQKVRESYRGSYWYLESDPPTVAEDVPKYF